MMRLIRGRGHNRSRRAQVLIEFAVAAFGLVVLAFLTGRVARWLNESMVERNSNFQNTRLAAGSAWPGTGVNVPSEIRLIGPAGDGGSGKLPPQPPGPDPGVCDAGDALLALADDKRDTIAFNESIIEALQADLEVLETEMFALLDSANQFYRNAAGARGDADYIEDFMLPEIGRLGNDIIAINARIAALGQCQAQHCDPPTCLNWEPCGDPGDADGGYDPKCFCTLWQLNCSMIDDGDGACVVMRDVTLPGDRAAKESDIAALEQNIADIVASWGLPATTPALAPGVLRAHATAQELLGDLEIAKVDVVLADAQDIVQQIEDLVDVNEILTAEAEALEAEARALCASDPDEA